MMRRIPDEMNPDMEKQVYPKKLYGIFYLWLGLLAAALAGCALLPQTQLPGGTVKTTGTVLLVFLVLLHALVTATGCIWWTGQIAYEDAAAAGAGACRRYGAVQLLIFTAALLLYLLYCQRPADLFYMGSIVDSLVAAGCICIAVVISGRLPFQDTCKKKLR